MNEDILDELWISRHPLEKFTNNMVYDIINMLNSIDIIFIVGSSSSGKTTILRKISEKLEDCCMIDTNSLHQNTLIGKINNSTILIDENIESLKYLEYQLFKKCNKKYIIVCHYRYSFGLDFLIGRKSFVVLSLDELRVKYGL